MSRFTSSKPEFTDQSILHWITRYDIIINILIIITILSIIALYNKMLVYFQLISFWFAIIGVILFEFLIIIAVKIMFLRKPLFAPTQKMRCANGECKYTVETPRPYSLITNIKWYRQTLLGPLKCPACTEKTYSLSAYGNDGIETLMKSMSRWPYCQSNGYYCSPQGKLKKFVSFSDTWQQEENNCNGVLKCSQLDTIIIAMKQYDHKKIKYRNNEFNVELLLNNYLHFIHCHNKDEDFEFIVNKLSSCDINNCTIFTRNNRNRFTTDTVDYDDDIDIHYPTEVLYCDIMDKIHCYFHHCFDIGNRLTINEKRRQRSKADIMEILSSRKQLKKRISTSLHSALDKKYVQLKDATRKHQKYSFGYLFKYGYVDEFAYGFPPRMTTAKGARVKANNEAIDVFPKYASLKEEATNNAIARMAIGQFNNENNKAELHFNMGYRKSNIKWIDMPVQCILSLMIYCNYMELQYQLSKTYRENEGKSHCNFFHLGKYLK
eukprot:30823_1